MSSLRVGAQRRSDGAQNSRGVEVRVFGADGVPVAYNIVPDLRLHGLVGSTDFTVLVLIPTRTCYDVYKLSNLYCNIYIDSSLYTLQTVYCKP